MNPKISIGIPCYNQGQYLSQAVESVLEQTLKSYEIIICNDGSTDNSLQVAKSYENVGVKIINQVNKGLASARNTILMNSTGDWLLFLDADDMFLENCLEKISEAIERNPDADIIAPSLKNFGINNQPVVLMPNPTLEDFKTGNRIGYFSAIRRSKLLEIGGYNPKMSWGFEDYDIWFDLLKRGAKLITLPDILILYRVKKDSMVIEAFKHQEELMAQIKKNHPEVYGAK